MAKVDSIDKIVTAYFQVVASESFTYKKKTYTPKDIYVSPGIFRGYTCPPGCGGCCHRFSLDYLPSEVPPAWGHHSKEAHQIHQLIDRMAPRSVKFNDREVLIFSDTQADRNDHHCINLDHDTGRCLIHGSHPFTCDFELLRFSITTDPLRANMINQRLYGRGWQFLRVDGKRGALCEMIPVKHEGDESIPAWTENWVTDAVRKMTRLQQWASHFGLATRIDEIIEWLNHGPHETPLYIKNRKDNG